MYGDTELIRRRVSALRDQGAEVRALADELVARVEGLGWSGRAADAMTERVSDRARHLRAAADGHVSAADALASHAEAVDAATDDIDAVETRVTAMVADARSRIAAIAAANEDGRPAVTPDPTDEALAAFVAPPRGHRDWLDVDVPGLER
ncbi:MULTISPECIES: WXG100 family type VII secretion target [unclassified Nocardioides]|uniref:WXG100 family type VII secretion target n=1 Tax=unclassified Nocardioides TaxID=2615069 RepID=UPI000700E619|nr:MULTISPECIES: hypothetical protein [unclassified Nocardioides]KRA38791.1 hypothetical protein ASD81_09380 [Nocardioides sp. Root614]KRA92751.1 hypothetical protein ASD84_09645 [Nocardioides sp. Root682]